MSFIEKLELINADIEYKQHETFERLLELKAKEIIDAKFEILESNCD